MSFVERLREAARRDRGPLLVALAFFALGCLWLGSSAHYHGDERYYTDAALRMLARGDPWTPEYADGAARLNKPLLSYWVLMASFAAAGVSLFVARLPFLLAGALTVFLTGKLARALFSEPRSNTTTSSTDRIALVASAIAAANVELSTLSMRSTPDILLVLSITIAWIGVARVLVAREPGAGPAWWLWIGVGLAVAVKGALGLLVALFALVAVLALRRRGARVRDLVSWPALLTAVVIGAVGLAPQWMAARAPGGANLFDDQVGDRVAGSIAQSLQLLGRYGGSIVRQLLPWSIVVVVGLVAARPAMRERWRRHARAFVLVGAFAALLWIVFSLGNTHRGRYLAPIYPPVSCALACLVLAALEARASRWFVDGVRGVIGVLTAVLSIALFRLDVVTALSLCVVALIALAPVGRRRAVRVHGAATAGDPALGIEAARSSTRLALSLCAVSVVAAEGIRAWVDPSPVAIAARASDLDATLGFTAPTRGLVRVVSRDRLDPVWLPDGASDDDIRRRRSILATAPAAERLRGLGYRLEPCGRNAPDLKPSEIVPLLTCRDADAWFGSRGEPVWIARRAE